MDDLSVGASVCLCIGLSNALWKNGRSDPDAVWHHSRTGPGMRQRGKRDEDLGIGPREGVLLGANLGRTIVTNGDFTASVCDSASTVGAAVCGGVCGEPRHCCITWGSMSCNGKGRFWGFCSPFSQWEMPLGRQQ